MAKGDNEKVKGVLDYGVQKVEYSSGFFIGKTPLNRVVINFYNDIPTLPKEFEIEFDENGECIGDTFKTKFNEKYSLQRIIQNIIQLDIDTARELAKMILAMVGDKDDADE